MNTRINPLTALLVMLPLISPALALIVAKEIIEVAILKKRIQEIND